MRFRLQERLFWINTILKKTNIYFQLQLTLGMDLTSFFFFCGMSESESSSESVPELEELSGEELLSWLPGPLPFSSEALQHIKRDEC